MSRHLRFSAFRRSVMRATNAVATNIRSENCRYQVRHLLYIWSIIFVLIFFLVIFSLAVFIYLVPCPVWLAGSPQVVVTSSNNSNLTYGDFDGNVNSIDVHHSTSSLPPSSSFTNNFYTWKCPDQSLYFVQEEYTTLNTTSSENETFAVDVKR